MPHAEAAVRADLAERLSVLTNAPRGLVGKLAREDEIAIAGPLLRRSPVLDDKALVEIARAKGQGHLLAISERPTLSCDVTDVLIRRGDREVVRRAAGNAGASFSSAGYSALIKRAGHDGVLTLAVGQRDDLSAPQLKGMLDGSIDIVRRRLFEVAKPDRQAAIKRTMSEISGAPGPVAEPPQLRAGAARDPGAACAGELNEAALLGFAKGQNTRNPIAALSAMSSVKIATARPADLGRPLRSDPDRRQDHRPRMGDRARLILLRLGPSRTAGAGGHRDRAGQFHAPDALDRRAGRRFLADPSIGVSRLHRHVRERSAESFPKPQIGRVPAFALGFASVARHGVAGPGQPPVGGAFRGPGEIRRARQVRQRPGAVVGDIADEAEFALAP